MILITTSRRPTQRIRTLCNDLQRVFPNAIRINRGKLSRVGLSKKALEIGADRVVIIERWNEGAVKIKLSNSQSTFEPFFTICITKIKTQEEVNGKKTFNKIQTVWIEKNASPRVKLIANFFSKFLFIPFLKDINTMKKASVHFLDFKINKVRISFIAPPKINEIGPILTVKEYYDKSNLGETSE